MEKGFLKEKEVLEQKVVVIIPAFNEEERISNVIRLAKKYASKVVVVDDGSFDKTSKVAKEAKADVVVSHAINSGKGIALYTGFVIAEKLAADIIVTLDADGQHDASKIPKFVSKINSSGSDIVIGARQKSSRMPAIFRLGNFVLNTTFEILYGQKVTDTQSGYRAFARDVFEKIKWESNGYVVETEMLAHARKRGLKISEIPIANTYHNKYKGTTIFDGMKIFIKMLRWRVF